MNVELFIDGIINDHQRELMLTTHELLMELLPNVRSSIKWNTPFYMLGANFCYLNTYKDHMYISFLSADLYKELPHLSFENKLVAKLYVSSLDLSSRAILEETILACAEIFIHERERKKT